MARTVRRVDGWCPLARGSIQVNAQILSRLVCDGTCRHDLIRQLLLLVARVL